MKANLKETIRNEYVHGYINALGQRVMPTLDDLIAKYEVPSSTVYRTSIDDSELSEVKKLPVRFRLSGLCIS